MKRYRALAVAAALLVGVSVVSVDARQDLTTQLALFLRDLRSGILGATQAITNIRTGNGTAAAPAYSFTGQTNKGIHGAVTGGVTVAVGGSNIGVFAGTGLNLGTLMVGFAGGDPASNSIDASLTRAAQASLAVGGSSNGQVFGLINTLTELTTIAAAATTDTTIQMPANSVVLGVSVRVTTVIPTCATFTVGDSGSAARFSTTTVSCAANSTDVGTKSGAYYNASALSIRITPNASPAANTGRVRTTIYYYTITPPTS